MQPVPNVAKNSQKDTASARDAANLIALAAAAAKT